MENVYTGKAWTESTVLAQLRALGCGPGGIGACAAIHVSGMALAETAPGTSVSGSTACGVGSIIWTTGNVVIFQGAGLDSIWVEAVASHGGGQINNKKNYE